MLKNLGKIEFWLSTKADVGLLLLRIFIGLRIVYGAFDNIVSWDKMMEFSEFLKANHFPAPTFCAVLSVYAQFIAAVLILVGYKTRLAAAVLVFNFIVAITMVHLSHTIERMTPALAMLFVSTALLFTGSGKYAVEKN
jgi:putative oxidoreductase